MSLVFDTSILIEIDKKNIAVIEKLRELTKIYRDAPKITFINYFEFYHGLREKNTKNRERSLQFLNLFQVIEITKDTAHILSDIKDKYEKKGRIIPLADLLVASQVIENKLVLVTLDKDFERIEELNKIIL